jgi:hypothetical protein
MCPVPLLRLQRLHKKEKEWTRYKLPLSGLFLSENNISSFGKVNKHTDFIYSEIRSSKLVLQEKRMKGKIP